jgi:acyl carrier protein
MLSFEHFKYIVLGFAGIVIAGGLYAVNRSERARILKRVGDRHATSDAEFSGFFSSAAESEIAIDVRNQLKKYLLIPINLVQPDDKLCADLGLDARDGLDPNSFVMDVEKTTGIKIPDAKAVEMLTLRDIVLYVHAARAAQSKSELLSSGHS